MRACYSYFFLIKVLFLSILWASDLPFLRHRNDQPLTFVAFNANRSSNSISCYGCGLVLPANLATWERTGQLPRCSAVTVQKLSTKERSFISSS